MKKLREKLRSPDIDSLPPIPLNELADDLGAIADELRCAYELDKFADDIDAIGERITDRQVLNERMAGYEKQAKQELPDGSPRALNMDTTIRHCRRDRRFQEDMKLILKAGGKTYRGQRIQGGKNDPYIQRLTRQEVIAEFKGDWRNQLGRKTLFQDEQDHLK
jgi:hypothetical protein